MKDFQNRLMNERPPKTANFLISSIISPKGIKRAKSTEGSDLFDDEEMDQSENICDKNDKGEDVDV